jgi:hypothetical protein
MALDAAALIPASSAGPHRQRRAGSGAIDDAPAVDDGSATRRPRWRCARGWWCARGGRGGALRSGLAVFLGEPHTHVLMLDGDGQYDRDILPSRGGGRKPISSSAN